MDCQRWKSGRDSYRPAGEPINASAYGVEAIDETTAKRFVITHHYARSYPAARFRAGLFHGTQLVGVAVFSVPMNINTIAKYSTASDGAELGRFVLLDDVPANGETWFLARAFKLMRLAKPEIGAVVSYSDPIARTSISGDVVKPGHFGTIYQAHNARYVGRARAETLTLDAGGRVVSRRALSKIRNDEQGAAYAYAQLLEAGAPRRQPMESGPAYVARAIAEGPFRKFRHPGNHAYVWTLARGVEHRLDAHPYPKAA